MNEYLRALAEAVESSAYWRAQKALKFPSDKRNARSSEALLAMARRLRNLTPDSPEAAAFNNTMLRAEEFDYEEVRLKIAREQSQYVGRYGFEYIADGDPRTFLDELTEKISGIVEEAEEKLSEAEADRRFELAEETATDAAKGAARDAATEAAQD